MAVVAAPEGEGTSEKAARTPLATASRRECAAGRSEAQRTGIGNERGRRLATEVVTSQVVGEARTCANEISIETSTGGIVLGLVVEEMVRVGAGS